MIYYDGIHLASPSLSLLHEYAQRIGLKKCWFDSNSSHPHYDLPVKLMSTVRLDPEVIKCNPKELVRKCFRNGI